MVRPKIDNMLRAVRSAAALPAIASWEIDRINDCLNNDLWYLRRVAKSLRPPEPPPPSTTAAAGGEQRPLACNWSTSATRGDRDADGSAAPSYSPSGAAAAAAAAAGAEGAAASSGHERSASRQEVDLTTPRKNKEVTGNSGNGMLEQNNFSPSRRNMVLNTILEEQDSADEGSGRTTRGAQAEVLMEQMRRLDREVAAARGRLNKEGSPRSASLPALEKQGEKPDSPELRSKTMPATRGAGTGDSPTRGMVPTSVLVSPRAAPATTSPTNAASAPESLEPPWYLGGARQDPSPKDGSKLSAVVGSRHERLRPSDKRRPSGSSEEQGRASPKDKASTSPVSKKPTPPKAMDATASPVKKQQSAVPAKDAPTSPASAGGSDVNDGGKSPPATIGCICGYTCGTAKALDKHLANYANSPDHGPQYTFA